MRIRKSLPSLAVCLALILCSLSLSSFASLFPFVASVKEETVAAEKTAPADADESETAAGVPESTAEKDEEASAVPEGKNEPEASDEDTAVPSAADETEKETVPEPTEPAKVDPRPYESLLAGYAVSNGAPAPRAAVTEADGALNADIQGALTSAEEGNAYTFTVTERGALQIFFTREKSTAVWRVSLYQRYFANGFDGNAEWRLLHQADTDASKTCDVSPHIGLQKGVYRIVVTAGGNFSAAPYTLKAAFDPGTEYEIEYNDSFYRYTEICPGVPVKGSASCLPEEKDADYYMLRVYDPSRVKLTFEHTRADELSVLWRVSLYDAQGAELYADNSEGTSASVTSGELGLTPGCYFICVRSRVYSDFDYTLTVSRTVDGTFETEPNGTVASADILPLNSRISGALTAASGENDTDVFALTLEQPGFIRLTFTPPEGKEENGTHRVTLTDAQERGLWESVVSPLGGAITSAPIGLAAGTYYVSVDNNGLYANSGSYVVSDEFTPADNWESEFNGKAECADPILPNKPVSGTIVDCEAEFDDDYYTFTLQTPAIIALTLTHEAKSGDKHVFSVSLLDRNGTAVQAEDEDRNKLVTDRGTPVTVLQSLASSESVSCFYTLPTGTYYIRVTSGLFSPDMQYELSYSVKTGG